MATKRCFYEILGVSRTCSDADLKSAFRKQAVQHHPDKNPGDRAAEAKFKEINEAYQILSDGQKRAAYDQHGHSAFEHGGGGGGGFGMGEGFAASMADIFDDLFGDVMGGGGAAAQPGASAARTCVTTWKSRWKRRFAASRRR